MSETLTFTLGHGGDDISQARLVSRQIQALVGYTVRESLHRWTLITYLIGITFFLILLSTAVNLDIVEGTLASARLFGQDLQIGGQEIPVGDVVRWFQVGIITTLYSIGVTYLVAGSWTVLRIKTGLGGMGFLLAGLVILFVYAVCYSATVLTAIITRNGPVSGMIGLMVWIGGHVMYPFHVYTEWRAVAFPPGWRRQAATALAEGLYWTLPKSEGLRQIAVASAQNEPVSFLPILYSIPFAVLCLFLACWWFTRHDY